MCEDVGSYVGRYPVLMNTDTGSLWVAILFDGSRSLIYSKDRQLGLKEVE